MNPRLATCLIWLTLVMVWPVSMLGLDGSFTPVARFIQLASALSWLGFLEGTEGMVGLFIGLLWGHAVVYGAVLFAISFALVRLGLARLPGGLRAGAAVAVMAAVILWGVFITEYDTQFPHSSPHASWSELYR